MNEQFLPTHYHLEVYEDSFANDPSYILKSSTPLPSISVGEYFSHRTFDGWSDRPNTETEKFVVKQVEHIFWTVEDSHNSHKLMVALKKEPYTW